MFHLTACHDHIYKEPNSPKFKCPHLHMLIIHRLKDLFLFVAKILVIEISLYDAWN